MKKIISLVAVVLLLSQTACTKKAELDSLATIKRSISFVEAKNNYLLNRIEKNVVDNGSRPLAANMLKEARETINQGTKRPLTPENPFVRAIAKFADTTELLTMQRNYLTNPEDTIQKLLFELQVSLLKADYIDYKATESPAGEMFSTWGPVVVNTSQPKAGETLVAQILVEDFDGHAMELVVDSSRILWTDSEGKALKMPMKINTTLGVTTVELKTEQPGDYYITGDLGQKYKENTWIRRVSFRKKITVQ